MKKKIVYTGGTFDLFHAGHVNFLRQCAELGAMVIVALNSDEFCEKYKRWPVMRFDERAECLVACKYVNLVVKNIGESDSKITINGLGWLKPDIIAIGDDWKGRDYFKQMGFDQKWLDEKKIELVYLPYTKGVSTTEIIKRIKS